MLAKKKIICLLLAAVMLLSLAACGTAAAPAETVAPAVEPTEAPAAAPAPAEAEVEIVDVVVSDIDQQLSLIYSQVNTLLQKGGANTWYYTVADLDHDGSLEFIAASQHPADRSTNVRIWSVNADRTGLTETALQKDEDESFPDILTDCADVFHVEATDTWYYLINDNIVISDTEIYTIKTAVDFKNGVTKYTPFAIEHMVLDNARRNVSHMDTNGFAISQEQYNSSAINAFVGAIRSSVSFEWLTEDKAVSLFNLADSYAVFMGEKAPTEVYPVPEPAALSDDNPALIPLYVSKNPTGEKKVEGETALFIAYANLYDSLTWTFVSPNGGAYAVQGFKQLFPGCSVSGEYSTTLSISKVASGMNGWGVFCTFYYKGQTARTSTAYLSVTEKDKPAPTPTPAPTAAPDPYDPYPTREDGELSGVVEDYNYDYVVVDVTGVDLFHISKDMCTISGEIYIGAPAVVKYDARGARGVHVCGCTITGREPEPQPVYGSTNGTVYREYDNTLTVFLKDDSTISLPTTSSENYKIEIYNGTLEDIGFAGGGMECLIYYVNTPSAENVYLIKVFIEKDAAPEPDPEPDVPEPAPEPDPEPAPEPATEPDPEPAPEPVPDPEPSDEPNPSDEGGEGSGQSNG